MVTTNTVNKLDLTPPENFEDLLRWLAQNFIILHDTLDVGVDVTDTFTTTDGKTVTVEHGIIKSIV